MRNEVDSGRAANAADSSFVPGVRQVRTGRAPTPGRVTAFDYRATRRGRRGYEVVAAPGVGARPVRGRGHARYGVVTEPRPVRGEGAVRKR